VLALVERYLARIQKARSDSALVEVLTEVAAGFGFRSGYLMEYTLDLKSIRHILDSRPERVERWRAFMESGLRGNLANVRALLEKDGVHFLHADRFPPNEPMRAFAQTVDIEEQAVVPVSFSGAIIGVGGFSGDPTLSEGQKTALQLITYSLFAQARSYRNISIPTAAEPLTPREKQVITLSADGLTSTEIAERLGMSARTVNQHVDNVADKLGTKNRAHTVAEVIRHGLLN
jgi:LuxR family transcriptional regulator, quorum-sensing system regulator BjaR1